MSQSNDRGQQRPGHPPHGHGSAQHDPYADPQFANQHPQADQARQDPGYPQQYADPNAQHTGYDQPHPGQPQTGYPQQPQQPQQHFDPTQNAPAHAPDPNAYPDPNAHAPQFAPYTPAGDPQQQQAPAPAFQDPAAAHDPYAQHAPAANPNLHGANPDDWSHAASPAPAHGYDAGGYAGAVQQQPYTQQDPATGQPFAPGHGNEGYGTQPAQMYADDPNLQHDVTTGPAHHQYDAGYDDQDYADGYDGADSAAGGTSRTMLIVGALVGAVVVGGGLAYGWKMISGSNSANSGKTPVVRSASTPSKTKPANPGGRQFDHADSKIMGRLGDARSGTSPSNGPRKVVTVPVGRNGKLQPAGASSSSNTVSVPGLTVVDAFGAANRANPTGGSVAVVPPTGVKTKAAPAKSVAPVIISKRSTSGAAAPAKKTPTVTKKATAPAAKPKPKRQATAPVTSPPAATATGANGFVAVLASVPVSSKSRMSALMQYADMQQKYGAVLANKTPDVREANLGTKGKYHRLLVGPPASRAQASALCAKLKAAGHTSCWVTAY